MKSTPANSNFSGRVCILCAITWASLSVSALFAAQQSNGE